MGLGFTLITFGLIIRIFTFLYEVYFNKTFWDAQIDFETGKRIISTGSFYDPQNIWQSPYPPLTLLIFTVLTLFSGEQLLVFVLYLRIIEICTSIIAYHILRHHLKGHTLNIVWGLYLTSFPALWLIKDLHASSYIFILFLMIGIYYVDVRDQLRHGVFFIILGSVIKWFTLPILFLLPFWPQWTNQSLRIKVQDLTIYISTIISFLLLPIIFFPNYLMIYDTHIESSVLNDLIALFIAFSIFFVILVSGTIFLKNNQSTINIASLVCIALAASTIPVSIVGPGRQYLRILLLFFPLSYSLTENKTLILNTFNHRERSIYHQKAGELNNNDVLYLSKWKEYNLYANGIYLLIGLFSITILFLSINYSHNTRKKVFLFLVLALFTLLSLLGDSPLFSIMELMEF